MVGVKPLFETQHPQRCLKCGCHVTPDFRRTFGDEQGRAHRCPNCDVMFRINRGSACGQDVAHPDPLEQPERFRDPVEELPTSVQALIRNVATDGGVEDV